jgi:hypothetical protein
VEIEKEIGALLVGERVTCTRSRSSVSWDD